VVGPHGGPCLSVTPVPGERTEVAMTRLHQLMRQRGEQPAVVQTDRGPCFVGAEGGERRALPGRLTLWLWGLGIAHRLLPPGKPWRNGAVERFQGAVEHSWAGEPLGLPALVGVWNHGKPAASTPRPFQDRAGFDFERVWQGLARARVERRVDPQGKLSIWDRPLYLGAAWAQRTVLVTFDAATRQVVIRDTRDRQLLARTLPWLTAAWLWAEATAELPLDPHGTPTFG
jgi:transposase InsO family protein